jgi:thiamine-phosphate pyrophosphorylase
MIVLPKLYPIVDSSFHADTKALVAFCEHLHDGGCSILQYRNKRNSAKQAVGEARVLKQQLGDSIKLIMNDRADLCIAAEFDGVHLGQDDLSPDGARNVIGPNRWLGVSTHNPEQVIAADQTSANYLAIGPVFATTSKQNPDPIIGLEGVRRARELTCKPLVAIGGITRSNCRSVMEVGADSVAVISDLIHNPRNSAEEFLSILR